MGKRPFLALKQVLLLMNEQELKHEKQGCWSKLGIKYHNDAILRHMGAKDKIDDSGYSHSVCVAARALMACEIDLEEKP